MPEEVDSFVLVAENGFRTFFNLRTFLSFKQCGNFI